MVLAVYEQLLKHNDWHSIPEGIEGATMKDVNPSLVDDFLPKFVNNVNNSNRQREKWLRQALGEEDEDVLTYGESGLFYRAENRAMAKHKAKQKGIELNE